METKQDNGEVIFLNNPPWLVTNMRVCWPNGVIRLSDVRSAEIVSKNNGVIVIIIAFSLIVPGTVFFGVFGWLLLIPGFLAFRFRRFQEKLKVHCASGEVVLMQTQILDGSDSKQKAEFRATLQRMESIQDAIRICPANTVLSL